MVDLTSQVMAMEIDGDLPAHFFIECIKSIKESQ